VQDTPPATASVLTNYSYTFVASGIPAPTYKLAPGAPSWLSINATTGVLTGAVPLTGSSFTYSVTASNPVGTVTAGPFTVSRGQLATADVSAALSCTSSGAIGATFGCTVTVSNTGPSTAANVVADLLLPEPELSYASCTPACTADGNGYTWSLGSLSLLGTSTVTVTLTAMASVAGTAQVEATAESQTQDPDQGNNTATQEITVEPWSIGGAVRIRPV
jgi:uncharacterized repeat protein (TIGR01451 family)